MGYLDNSGLSHLWDKIKSAMLPIGAVIMWAGTYETIPAGWHLCDGTNGTVDLRERFIVAATEGEAGIFRRNETGGSLANMSQRLTTDQLPNLYVISEHGVVFDPTGGSYGTHKIPTVENESEGNVYLDTLYSMNIHPEQMFLNTTPPYAAIFFIQKIA